MDTIDFKSPAERYKDIADAIREKNGTTETMQPADMPQAILDIAGGNGTEYTSIVYNDDDTITLFDTDGTEHTMVCTYEDGVLTSVTYDDKQIAIVYEDNKLIVGNTVVDLKNAKTSDVSLDNTVTFLAYGEPYEVVSVKNGNSVNSPATPPQSVKESFIGWHLDGKLQTMPFTPSGDVLLEAIFSSALNEFYRMNGISKDEYPDFILFTFGTTVGIYVAQKGAFKVNEYWLQTLADKPNYHYIVKTLSPMTTDVDELLKALTPTQQVTLSPTTKTLSRSYNDNYTFYTNTGLSSVTGVWNNYG